MELLTKELKAKMPPLNSTDRWALPVCKFFNPCGAGTWYVTERLLVVKLAVSPRPFKKRQDYGYRHH